MSKPRLNKPIHLPGAKSSLERELQLLAASFLQSSPILSYRASQRMPLRPLLLPANWRKHHRQQMVWKLRLLCSLMSPWTQKTIRMIQSNMPKTKTGPRQLNKTCLSLKQAISNQTVTPRKFKQSKWYSSWWQMRLPQFSRRIRVWVQIFRMFKYHKASRPTTQACLL